jgi:hypothetical protein
MHVREVNPVENSTSLHYLEPKSPHEQIPKLDPNRLKFLASIENRTQALRERLYPTRIKHHALPILKLNSWKYSSTEAL